MIRPEILASRKRGEMGWNHRQPSITRLIMRQIITLLAFLLISCSLSAQENSTPKKGLQKCFTVGFLQGGGSLIGLDFEIKPMANSHLGIQVGAGALGYGAGINLHFKKDIRSPFLSVQYWHQGIRDTYVQSLWGPNFVFRGKRWFTFQIGAGRIIERGPNFPEEMEKTPVILTYAVGVYII